ncbi:hypothetical protein H6769_06935 [Candidatus Peribacteria bacterium]|nr:hypothetical protein [Candidatus Peribacteria bacterium]
MEVIGDIVRENGYSLGKSKPLPWLSNNIEDYASVLGIAALLLVAYMFLSHSGISFSGLSGVGSPTLGVAFIVGLTAGISSCMALVGGLILGISAKWNQGNANNS